MKRSVKSLWLLLIISLVLSFSACKKDVISLDDIPDYSGAPYVEINGGEPFFDDDEITTVAFESYSELDALGRCGVAFACLGLELAPTEERGDISSIRPSGFDYNGASNNREYDFGYIYNRCHLIGFQLAGENDNEKNLITGTYYMNVEGMLPFEDIVDDYIEETQNHVMYRVTPIFDGLNYLASGVLMEAYSVEDEGAGVEFCVYVYNVQPGIEIDYFTGRNHKVGETLTPSTPEDDEAENGGASEHYILNKNSKKFHYPDKNCSNSIKEENREEYYGSRENLVQSGYDPCGICKP